MLQYDRQMPRRGHQLISDVKRGQNIEERPRPAATYRYFWI